MAKPVTKYKCDFCRKTFASKSYAEKHHEPICFYNPIRKGCATCENFISDGYQKCDVKINIEEKLKVECSLHRLKRE